MRLVRLFPVLVALHFSRYFTPSVAHSLAANGKGGLRHKTSLNATLQGSGKCGGSCYCGGGRAPIPTPPAEPNTPGCRRWSTIKAVGDSWHNYNCGSDVTDCRYGGGHQLKSYSDYKRCRDGARTACYQTNHCDRPNVVYTMNHPGSKFFYKGAPVGGFRRDCSGITSAMLGLRTPGETTRTLNSKTYGIEREEMQPGDILNKPGAHVIVFAGWDSTPGGSFWAYEEKGDRGVIISKKSGSYGGSAYQARRVTSSCWHGSEKAEGGSSKGKEVDPDDQDNGVPGEVKDKEGAKEGDAKDTGTNGSPDLAPMEDGSSLPKQEKPKEEKKDKKGAEGDSVNWWSDPPPWWSANPPEWGSPHGSFYSPFHSPHSAPVLRPQGSVVPQGNANNQFYGNPQPQLLRSGHWW